MHDMIGASGMLRGWAAVWHMQLVWLLVMLVMSVALTAVIESLVATFRSRVVVPKFNAGRAAAEVFTRVAKPW
jgi:hypothetical protein